MWTAGLLGAGFATSDFITDNILRLWLLLSFSAIGGVGLGTGYITPVSTLMKWFPDRRGFATGLAIMGGIWLWGISGRPVDDPINQCRGRFVHILPSGRRVLLDYVSFCWLPVSAA